MNQLNLFDPHYNELIPAPFSEPTTSKAAAKAIEPSAEVLRGQVLAYIRSQGERGATDEEIQQALEMQGNTERPRRGELVEAGLVKKSDATRKTSSGRAASVWVAK